MSWYYENQGETYGPLTDAQLDAARSSGQVPAGARFWREGWPEWRFAEEVWGPRGVGGGTASAQASGPWRDGNLLVVSRQEPLPHCCTKCGAPPSSKLRKQFAWHHPGFYFLILFGLLPYVIIALIMRKVATVELPLCASCNGRRKLFITVALVGFLSALALLFAPAYADLPYSLEGKFIGAGFLVFLFSLCWMAFTQFFVPKKITDGYVWIGKTGRDMLAKLPQWPRGE